MWEACSGITWSDEVISSSSHEYHAPGKELRSDGQFAAIVKSTSMIFNLFIFDRKKEAGGPKLPKISTNYKNVNGYTKRMSLQKN